MLKHSLSTKSEEWAVRLRFGETYRWPLGYIAKVSKGEYNHRFGGTSWCTDVSDSDVPALLIVFDLNDPRLSELKDDKLNELPLFSYINSDCWVGRQDYKVSVKEKKVTSYNCRNPTGFVLDDKDKIPVPLPESPLLLEDMLASDYPLDENSYWDCTDEFLGGGRFIRVLGQPLWLQEPMEVVCSCGKKEQFVACVGYENWEGSPTLLKDRPFFLGEGGLYFFFCKDCSSVSVISQFA